MKKEAFESLDILKAILLAWMGWQSVVTVKLLARVSVLEDREGIHADEAQVSSLKKDIWASAQLFRVPVLTPKPKAK